MQRIRDWMAAHPDEAAKVRATNRSYVFFRITGLSNEGEPVGAQGVPLTPGRSIAVDRLHEYGTPFFIEANLPIESVKPVSPFRRLMIAQDTGSAIVGPARADLYWGAGDDAGRIAGRIRHPGRFVMLLPRELDMVAAGRHMPLPVPKPKIAALEVKKQDGKGKVEFAGAGAVAAGRQMPSPAPKPKIAALEVRKQDGKGKANSANAGAIAAGRQKPLPALKPKIPAIEVRKQDGKGKAKFRQRRRDRGRQDYAVAGAETEGSPRSKSRNRTAKAKRNSASAGATGRPAEAVAGAETEDRRARESGNRTAKARHNSASTGAIATGRQKPSPTRTPKIAALEVGKQDGKANAGQKPPPAPTPRIAALEKQDIGRPILLPVLKPTNSKIEVKKQDPKGRANSTNAGEVMAGRHLSSPSPKSKKQSGKGKADSEIAAGREKPLSAPKPKITGIKVKKQDGKGSTNSANAGEIAAAGIRCRRRLNRRHPTSNSRSKTVKAKPIQTTPARSPPVGRSRCRCRNRRPLGSKSRNREAKTGQTPPLPTRSRPAGICRCRQQNRRCPGTKPRNRTAKSKARS